MRLSHLLPLSLLVFSLAGTPARADLSAQTIAELSSTDPVVRSAALRLRALDHEKQGRYADAQTDYIECLTETRKTDNRSREAELFTRIAYCQVRQGFFDDALANMNTATGVKGWIEEESFFLSRRALIFLVSDQPQKALDIATLLKNSTKDSGRVLGEHFEACARYLMGEEASLALGMGPDLYDASQLPFNRAVFLDPKSYEARVKRARFFAQRAEQKRFPNYYPDAPATTKGGWLNLIDSSLLDVQAHTFYQSAYYDWSRAIALEKRPADYAERALVASMLNEVAKSDSDKIPASRIASDIQLARSNSAHRPEVLRALGRFYGSTLPPIDSPEFRNALVRGISSYSLALLDAPTAPENEEVRDARKNLIAMFFSSKPLAPKERPTTAEAWKVLGNELSTKQEFGSALAAYEKALDVDPKYADAMNNIGSLYSKIGAYDLALDWFGKAIASEPKHRIAYYNRATTYRDLDQSKQALPDAMLAVQFAVTDTQKAEALTLRGKPYDGDKQSDKALADLTASLAINSEQYDAWAIKGQIELEKGALDASIASLQKATKLNDKSQISAALLAVAQFLQTGQTPPPLDLTTNNKSWMDSYLKQAKLNEVYSKSPQKERLEQARKLFAPA